MPTIKENILRWLADQLPTKRRTIVDVRQIARTTPGDLDVDRVHEIIEAAKNGQLGELMALYRDLVIAGNHLQAVFTERKEAVLGDVLSVQPVDEKDAEDLRAAAAIADMVEQCRTWEAACAHLLESFLYPVALTEKVFRPSTRVVAVKEGTPVRLVYELAELAPVVPDLLTMQNGRLQIRETDERGNILSDVFDPDPARYIVHRGHLLGTPDNFGGPMRSLVFWCLLGWNGRDWWARFLERYGAPFIVGKYNAGDADEKAVLMGAFSVATRLWGLVVSRDTEIELKQAAASDAGDAFDKWRVVCNEEISKLVSGVAPSDAKGTALGSDVPKGQAATKHDKRASDARRLGATLRHELCAQYLKINGLPGRVPKMIWASDTPDQSAATGELLVKVSNAGFEVEDDAIPQISERLGFRVRRKPAPAPALPPGIAAFSVAAQGNRSERAAAANETVLRDAAARLPQPMRKAHAAIVQLVATSSSPEDAVARVEAYCAHLDPVEASAIIEETLVAMAANGSVVNQ